MAYTVHTTPALIFKGFNRSEADKGFHLYTRDFGRIDASAKGIRLLKSKLRYALQTGSLSLISLVRGRHEWRIVNALPVATLFSADDPFARAKHSIFALIERLIAGELRDEELFRFIEEVFLFRDDLVEPKDLYYFASLSIIFRLGYYAATEGEQEVLFTRPSQEEIVKFRDLVKDPAKEITRALEHSHL